MGVILSGIANQPGESPEPIQFTEDFKMNANEMMQELRDGQQFRLKANHNITLRRAYDGAYEMVYPVAFACCAKHMSSMGQDDRIYFANQMCGTISFMITVDKWEAIE